MQVVAELRRRGIFARDRVKGGPLAADIAEIEAIAADPASAASEALRAAYLQDALGDAVANVPFYRDSAPASGEAWALDDFPVMDKPTLIDNKQRLLSVAFDADSLPQVHTSGSSGTPFQAPRDPRKRRRVIAELVAFGRLAGFDLGDPVVFLSVSRGLAGRSMRHRLQGIRYVPASLFDDDLVQRFLAAVDASSRPLALIGAPSSFDHVGRGMQAAGRAFRPGEVRAVVSISEAMTPWLAANSAQVFGVASLSRYSNEENGVLAQQTPSSSGRFVVNHGSYHLELLDLTSDRPVPPGEIGRIVITDLFARAMPFIRYDTGDLGRMSAEHPYALAEVVGRRMDLILGDQGQAVAPSALVFKMFAFDDIRQYQLVQTGRAEYRVDLIAREDPARDLGVQAALGELLGPNATIVIRYVREVASLPSGKRRPVANLWTSAPR